MLQAILIGVIVLVLVGGPLLWLAYSPGGILEGTDHKAKDRIQAQANRKAAEDRGVRGSDELLEGNVVHHTELAA